MGLYRTQRDINALIGIGVLTIQPCCLSPAEGKGWEEMEEYDDEKTIILSYTVSTNSKILCSTVNNASTH